MDSSLPRYQYPLRSKASITFIRELHVIPIIVGIVILLFTVQQFGTVAIGKFFGPFMVVWFSFLGYLGAIQIIDNPIVLKALNPMVRRQSGNKY